MRPIRYIMFLEAVMVILLHALIPHVHHGEMTFDANVKAHASAHTIFEIIGLKFHKHSSGDLDRYTLSQYNSLKKFPSNDALLFYGTAGKNDIQKDKFEYHAWIFRYITPSVDFHLESSGLRGPPVNNSIT